MFEPSTTLVASAGATIDTTAAAPLGSRAAYALSALSGFLYFLGFAATEVGLGFGRSYLWIASLVALCPLAIALEGQRPLRALGMGALAGFTMNVLGFYWLLEMLKTFSGFPTPLCVLFMCLLCAYQGGRIALFAWLYRRAALRGWPKNLVFLLAFAASELLWPLLFPWYFAASVHGVPALTQLAELGGPYLVGLVLAAPSLALAELVNARRDARPVHARFVLLALVTPALAALYGYVRLRQVDALALASEPLHVGLVQGDMPLMQARSDQVEALRRHLRMTEELRRKGVDLAIWSEAAVSFNVPEADSDAFLQRLFTRQLHVPSVFGSVLVRPDADGQHLTSFNTALATDKDGHVVGRYDKHYLLAFGEYLPFGETFPVLYEWSPNSGRLKAGETIDPVPVGGHRATVFICYEDILPSFVNRAVDRGHPDLLINLTNDAWFGDTTEPWIHLALAEMRAVEHRRYLVRSTNSGVSAIVDPVGRVIAHGGTFRQETVDAVVHWMKSGRTGYEIWGDLPWWLASAIVVAMGFRKRPVRPLTATA